MSLESSIEEALIKRAETDSLRSLKVVEGLVDFSSNDYLGFARDMEFAGGTGGSTGSRLLTGNTHAVEELEKRIAAFHEGEAALIYSSGYLANIGAITCMAGRTDTILFDELVHASIRDGIRLSNARSVSFAHNDLNDLKEKLPGATGNVVVIVESIYSMDGDGPDLIELAEICRDKASLMVDEAHAVGVGGPSGKGLVCGSGISADAAVRVVTFGKALGLHGAAVICSKKMREYMINFARTFIYTTGLPDSTVSGLSAAYDRLLMSSDKVQYTKSLKNIFKEKINNKTALLEDHAEGLILALVYPGNEHVKALSGKLAEKGYDVRPILSPTVPVGTERIRVCFHAFNTEEEVIGLASSINEILS